MNKKLLAFTMLAAISLAAPVPSLFAGCPCWLEELNPFRGTPLDVHAPDACNNCGHEVCVNRDKVEDCAIGEKKCYKSTVRKQYVAIPETRYKWEMKCVEKEIPCTCCQPVCKTEQVDHQYQVEHWEKQELPCGASATARRARPGPRSCRSFRIVRLSPARQQSR